MLNKRIAPASRAQRAFRKSTLMIGFALISVGLLSACSTLKMILGTEQPIDEKSKSYQVKDLSQGNSDWRKVDPVTLEGSEKQLDAPDSLSTSASDVTYLSIKDGSVISLNSSCEYGSPEIDLHTSSDEFFYGMREVTDRREVDTTIQNIPALQITAQGYFEVDLHESMILRTVSFRRGSCQFDFIYLATPAEFPRDESTFSSFAHSFRFTGAQ